AEFAAGEVGAKVTGITISQEQFDFATERMAKAGLSDKVEIRLQDYRDVSDTFDKVASIEMFEAVGKEYWPTYFKKVREVLRPGGLAGLQIITIDDQYFDRYTKSTDFIQRFVFPGGMLPSPGALRKEIVDAGLAWRDNVTFGVDYANTLRNWQERFLGAWDDIRPLGFDDRFKKLWRYYLSYCEAGFRGGTIDVTQVTLARP
ncbi:MAG: cyclopropane-fatty-acyl-phospholipid synthase family protein, partial [Pseudomonadota bacterium]